MELPVAERSLSWSFAIELNHRRLLYGIRAEGTRQTFELAEEGSKGGEGVSCLTDEPLSILQSAGFLMFRSG
jgi:hypothetical protein